MKYYNYCTTKPPPLNIAILLGLGAKFYLQTKTLNYNKFKEIITYFKYNIQIKQYIMMIYSFNNKLLPELHIKSLPNNILRAPNIIKETMKRFKLYMTIAFENYKK